MKRRLLHGDVLVGPDEGFEWLGSALERWAVDLDSGGEMLRKAAYVQRYRVAEAQRLLVTTDLDSAGVAVEAGFGSLSSYHEAFASVCGISRTRLRRQHLGTA